MNVLTEIIERTVADLQTEKRRLTFDAVIESAEAESRRRPAADVQAALRVGHLAVIAEVKRRSPSMGELAKIAAPAALAQQYAAAGASMISVLTEPHRFGGSLADLIAVRAAVETPILRKDFIVDEYQIAQARAAGADCVLLIAAALDDEALARLLACARAWAMEPLVEVHDEGEAARAVAVGAHIIGVNARNLSTLAVDTNTFARVVHHLPATCVRVAESGITSAGDAEAVAREGADVILVGQALVQADDPQHLIEQFTSIDRRQI